MASRTRRTAFTLLFAVLVVPSIAWTAPIVSNVALGQKDWFGPDGGLVARDSLWGYLSFDYVPDLSQTYFVNMSASVGGDSFEWVIQNIPLFASPTASSLGLEFDLGDFGITAGTDVSLLDVVLSFDSEFQVAPPSGIASTMAVEDLTYFAWDEIGAPGATETFDDPGRPKGNDNTAIPLLRPKDRDIKPLQEEVDKCFPGAMARSLDWLNREYKLGVSKPIGDIYKEVRDKVKDPAGSDSIAKETTRIRLKDEYAKATFKKIETKVYDPSDFVNAISGVEETTPKEEALLKWLEREIKTEDVELKYHWFKTDGAATDGAHIVTLVGVYTTEDGKVKVRFRDDEHQGNDKGDKEVKERELYLKDGTFRFGADQARLTFLVAESVPEPATVVLMGLGLALLGVRRRVRRPAVSRPTHEATRPEAFPRAS